MNEGWEQLLCPYYAKTCLQVLGEYFESCGFQHRESKIGGIVFYGRGAFVEVSYDPQSFPSYAPTLIVGMGAEKFDQAGSPRGVPIWFILSDDCAERGYSFWKFQSEAELESVLRRVLNEIIGPHVEPLFTRTELLTEAVKRFQRQL